MPRDTSCPYTGLEYKSYETYKQIAEPKKSSCNLILQDLAVIFRDSRRRCGLTTPTTQRWQCKQSADYGTTKSFKIEQDPD